MKQPVLPVTRMTVSDEQRVFLPPASQATTIAVVGAGYVGLVTAACLAQAGHRVACIDRDPARLDMLKRGQMPIYEPGLAELVATNVESGRLGFTDRLRDAAGRADVVFLAVGTPPNPDGGADLSQLLAAVRELAPVLDGLTVVVTKSTVPVGTGEEIERVLREANPDAAVSVASNPEFLREGSAIGDFMLPDRIVIGAEDEVARRVLAAVYQPFDRGAEKVQFTSRRTAELIKYAANAFLAMKVTFINEIAELSEKVGADILEVAQGIGSDSRIGPQFLKPGPGYGGSCFPKDTLALARLAAEAGAPLRLVETTVAVNDARKQQSAAKIVDACGGSVRGKTIGLLGLTFKPETDDMREAPSISIVRALQVAGATIKAYDPQGMGQARAILDDVLYCANAYEAAEGADALALVTDWAEFAGLDLQRVGRIMRARVLVDLRNFLDPEAVIRHGFALSAVGRPSIGRRLALPHPARLAVGASG